MRIGIMIGDETQLLSQPPEVSRRPPDLDALVREAQQMDARGFASAWLVNIFEFDAIGASAILGRETRRIEVSTEVVPTFPRHPVAMAQQALTAHAAARGRWSGPLTSSQASSRSR
jgi:alkanesulfonate monooxygenase SsuD/methylene tetrahydromethanopterin reductase-like flavin-dependent oxidoreductase (luciferase family)